MIKSAKSTAKSSMVAAKDRAIVLAARDQFLRDGFAGASMDGIARSAGVSVKTIYSHFANKNELFHKVMVALCKDHLLSGALPAIGLLIERFPWFDDATQRGLMEAGREYLGHLLSGEQLALYRVVTRDADRFPELGRQYHASFTRGRTGILIAYLRHLEKKQGWATRNTIQTAALYEALLRAGIYEEVLHGLASATDESIKTQARTAARTMWIYLTAKPG